ncbi:MAG: hypothetical protein ABIR70_05645 [Bryobacteraceae bacterium]
MLRTVFVALLIASSAFAADWTEYRVGPLRVVSNAGDADARKQLVEMEQIRYVLAGMLGKDPLRHEELDLVWPITLVLFDNDRDRAAYALPTPFVEGGSGNLSTTPSPEWRSAMVQQFIESNAGRMSQDVETALADLFATVEVKTTRVAIGAPVPSLPGARFREWAKLHMLATQPEYAGRLRVYLKNLQGGDPTLAAFNTYNLQAADLEKRMNAYADRGVFQPLDVFGEAITPSKEFYERRIPKEEMDALLAELQAGGKTFPPASPRGLLAEGTSDSFYAAAAANPKWGEPHARIAALMQDPKSKTVPLEKAVQLEPRRVEYWEALARTQVAANMIIEASKTWLGAERAAGTEAEKARIRRARAEIEERRIEAALAAQRAAKDEAERELRRVIAESDARVKAAEGAANKENRAQATFTEGQAAVTFKEAFTGVQVVGRLSEVECEGSIFKLIIEVPNKPIVMVLVQKNPEVDGKPVFVCGPVSPPRGIEVVHDGKADIRWNTVGEVDTYVLR